MKKSRWSLFRLVFNCKNKDSEKESKVQQFKEKTKEELEKEARRKLILKETHEFVTLRKIHFTSWFCFTNKEDKRSYERMRRLWKKYNLNYKKS